MANSQICPVMLITILLVASTNMKWAQAQTTNWATKKPYKARKEETTTTLQFYFHDTLSGSNPTAVRVAQSNSTDTSLTLFGMVNMADDPLTEGPDVHSKLVGRAQGLYGSSGQKEVSLLMAMSFCFLDGEYNGSSISILGKNSALSPVRELPVVGGTGVFRLARGYALARTYLANLVGDVIVGYNVTVIH